MYYNNDHCEQYTIIANTILNVYCNFNNVMACHTKFGPSKYGPPGPYFTQNMDQPELIFLQDLFQLVK